jgi:uncharacterized repeat protein (TIGR02543 family)
MNSKFLRIVSFVLVLLLVGGLFACKEPEVSVETFMVTFSKNIDNVTVSGMPSPQNIEKGKLVTEPTTNPSTSLYTFTGWYADAAATIPFNFSSTQVTGRLTIYAGWSLKVTSYQVTFNYNYQGSSAPVVVSVVSGQKVTKPADPVRPNYRFLYWSTQADAGYIFDFDSPITHETTLYAMWEMTYTLTYQYNTDGVSNVVVTYGDSENTVQPNDPVRTNFTFGGWFTDQLFLNPFTHGQPLISNTVLYAKWTRASYTVTFNLNYSGSTPFVVYANVNADVPVPAIPVRDGYVFDNWYTSATEQTEDTLYDFSPATNDTTIIYAGWKAQYVITFELNYDGAPASTTQIVVEGSEVEVFTPVREGFLFSGWYTDALCTHAYEFGAVNSAMTLYAKWSDSSQQTDEFTVTFDLNYTGSTPNEQIVPAGTAASRPVDPVREGYRFSGWMTTPTGTTTYKFGAVTENVTVYARWVNVWKITFNLGYSGAPAPQVIETLDGTRISKPTTPTRDGLWQFVTWNDALGSPFIFTTVIKENHQLYAVWTRSGYYVTWDFNFTGEPAPVTTPVMIGSIAREPQKPQREGNWAIQGWYLDEACTIPFSLTSEVTEDVTLYAKWASGFSYSLNLNYVGAPSIPTQILSSGSNIPARPVDPIRPNHTFVGWATSASGQPNFNGFGTPITSDVKLYAQWRHTYIFEAEYVSLAGKIGCGWSGGAAGIAMINKDTITEDPDLGTNANASNGFFLSYLYCSGLFIDFVITSDRAIDATLILRFSAEQKDPFVITDNEYLITVNGTKVNYGSITINGAYAALQQRKLPFSDVLSITISLNEGPNTIRFLTNNQNSMGGTMDATAPLIDCIKIDTYAYLTWNPVLENLSTFN